MQAPTKGAKMEYQDNQIEKRTQDMMPVDAYEVAKSGLEHAIEANRAVAIREMEVLSMQADEDEALLQSGNLSDEQFEKVMQDKKEIRYAMTDLSVKHFASNLELVLGFCAFALFGGMLFKLRVA